MESGFPEQQFHITLSFHLATGKVMLNEIVYRLQELREALMLRSLEHILRSYDDLISDRFSHFAHESIEAVIDTNYRRLIEGRSVDIFLGGIHRQRAIRNYHRFGHLLYL
jgi:hypothetical protein